MSRFMRLSTQNLVNCVKEPGRQHFFHANLHENADRGGNMTCNSILLVVGLLVGLVGASTDASAQAKNWTFQNLRAGNCHLDGTLVINANGTGTWNATSYTDHTSSGDVWHVTISVLDQNQTALFNVGNFDSPSMNDGNPSPRYTWSNAFNFNPAQFSIASFAQPHSGC